MEDNYFQNKVKDYLETSIHAFRVEIVDLPVEDPGNEVVFVAVIYKLDGEFWDGPGYECWIDVIKSELEMLFKGELNDGDHYVTLENVCYSNNLMYAMITACK